MSLEPELTDTYTSIEKQQSTTLEPQLNAIYTGLHDNPKFADISKIIKKATSDHYNTFDHSKAVKAGDTLPPFYLLSATGQEVTRDSLLSQGPVLISFYRGEWCPFCNLELRALQKRLPAFTAKGVRLVAISPQLPDSSLTTAEKNELEFDVLSDVGNKLAAQLGILFKQPKEMRTIFEWHGTDWQKEYGDDNLVVPVPATLLVDGKGVVKKAYVNPNYHERLEPDTALGWCDEL